MKNSIAYPLLDTGKGVSLLGQNRQFRRFHSPACIDPMVPASAAAYLKSKGFDVLWNGAIAEEWTQEQFGEKIICSKQRKCREKREKISSYRGIS